MVKAQAAKRHIFTVEDYYAMSDVGILARDEHVELLNGAIYDKYEGKPRLFNVDEYYMMGEAGILPMEARGVELIDGEVIDMSPAGEGHSFSVDGLVNPLAYLLWGRAWIRCQNPLRIGNFREPEPDVMVLRLRDDRYSTSHPSADDVLLLAEVGDSSVRYDRNVKLAMYARAGVPEVWLVNLPDLLVEVYTEPPDAYGDVYGRRRTFHPGESLTPTAFPDVSLPVSRIVPA